MTANPPGLVHVTDALVEMVRTATGLKVGDGDAPPDVQENRPYLVVIAIPGGYHEGDAGNTTCTVHVIYQITAVGKTRHEAEAARDKAHVAVLGRATGGAFANSIDAYHLETPAATAQTLAANDLLKVCDRAHDSSGGVDREGTVFNAYERYALWIVPV